MNKRITIFLASHNQHKLREILEIANAVESQDNASDILIDFVSFRNIGNHDNIFPPEETGKSFQENALIKLRAIPHSLSADYFLAEDSGLMLPSLDGSPGIYSSRYAGENASDSDNLDLLIKNIKKIPKENRLAKYVCVMALCNRKRQQEQIFIGECTGKIITEKKGTNGFGYDPCFWIQKFQKTMAELSSDIKNSISHRKAALQQVIHHIKFLEK